MTRMSAGRRTLLLLAVAAAAVLIAGCTSPDADTATPTSGGSVTSSDATEPPTATAPEVTDSGSVASPEQGGAVGKPTVAEAEAAVVRIAKKTYPSIPTKSAKAEAMGLDSQGRWWVQAWSDAGTEYEVEQWFAYWDGTKWTLKTYGTGLDRTELPADIKWEDVP